MKRSLILCSTVPMAVLMTACPSNGPGTDELGDETGISSLGTEEDSTTTATTSDDVDTFDTFEEDSTETADGTTTGPNCGSVMVTPEYVPPNIMLVVDASGSMIANTWDHDLDGATPEVTRWNTLYGVVETVMNNFGPQMNAGIQRFPSADACPNAIPGSSMCYNSGACIVADTPEVGVLPDNGQAILAAIPGPDASDVEIVGGTPAAAGFSSALAHLKSLPPTNPNHVLLITDGAANCVEGLPFPDFMETYDDNLQLQVGDAFTNDNIPTFVVGIDIIDELVGAGNDGAPYANAYEELNEVAVAGGKPKNMGMDADKFFNTTNEQELIDALSLILGEVTNCTIDLTMQDQPPPTADQIPYVTFEINGMDVPYVEDCDAENGWTWIVEGEIMSFCGSYCEDFKNGATMDGTYGCPPSE